MKGLGTILIAAFAFALAYYGAVLVLQRRMMYPRPPALGSRPRPPGVETLWLGTEAKVEAWLLPPAPQARPFPVVIFSHGNAELIDYWPAAFATLTDAGVGVLLVEYPGYGRSGGTPTQESITDAVVAAFDHLSGRPDVDAERIVAYGRSLGGGAACALAARRPLAGLILESSFSSVAALARRFAVPGALVLDPFDNAAVLSEVDIPTIVLHGDRDRIIPTNHGEILARAAGTELVRMPCGHNDCERPWPAVLGFLADHGITRSDP